MNLKKLSIALVISALTVSNAFAEEVTIDVDDNFNPNSVYQLIAACPTNDCPQVVTPKTSKCPKCHKKKNKCKCKQEIQEEENRCEEAPVPACELNEPSPCQAEENTCPAIIEEKEKISACATCPAPNPDEKKYMLQTYAYPAAVYGGNNFVGEKDAGIYIGENVDAEKTGIPVARENDGLTGAAAACPCVEDTTSSVRVEYHDNCNTISIKTQDSMEASRKSLQPYEISAMTGAAAPLVSAFEDVPSGFWAGCDINKLTENNIIAGYPDRTFKPNLPVSRAEMATLTVKGFNLLNSDLKSNKTFKDVPKNFWAGKMIDKAVANGLMEGYSDTLFKPNKPVTRAEAFTILSKGINCPMDNCQADEILNKYCDASEVPSWAKIPVAKAIQAGALTDSPKPDMINPNKDASRAEIASMLENIRVSLGYSNVDKVTANDCGCTGAAAYIEHEESVQLPTLALNFSDEINAKTSNIGDRFAATTTEDISVNGQNFPSGSTVRGRILKVDRPSKNCQGGLKLSFDTIEHEGCKADLPQQVLSAQVEKMKTPNPVARLVTMPFSWVGSLAGIAGRTVGGAIVNAGNAVENVVGGAGIGTGEVFQGEFKAAGRSYGDSIKNLVKAPIDTTRTALSGTMGLFQTTGDEVAYLVDPKGSKISSINPREKVTVAFGCVHNR
ncbi:MAG: S-layer homology domain-containing protein [Candidatus Gastranaerophilales bacterium]|nr:S-layer homology domain-containing protein [Candidatus Gastranaerophilales bacterium]